MSNPLNLRDLPERDPAAALLEQTLIQLQQHAGRKLTDHVTSGKTATDSSFFITASYHNGAGAAYADIKDQVGRYLADLRRRNK